MAKVDEGWGALLPAAATVSALMYLLSAGVGTAVAYDAPVALGRMAGILAGFALCALLGAIGRLGRLWPFVAVGYVAALLSLGLGTLVRSGSLHDPAWISGAVALLLPLQAGSVIVTYAQGRRLVAALLGVGLALSAWLLVFMGERSAWIGLGIGAMSAAIYVGGSAGRGHRMWGWAAVGWTSAMALLFGLYVLLLIRPELLSANELISRSTVGEHFSLWRQMAGLAGDYAFTGSGLGMTAMVASSYLFLVHVPLYYHAHNTPIQIALEQGVFGVIGFTGLTVATLGMALAVLDHKRLRVLGACGMASLIAVSVHGLLDSELYASAWAPLLFLPYGLIWGLYALGRRETKGEGLSTPTPTRYLVTLTAAAVTVTALGAAGWALPADRSIWYTNVGAVEQTRMELSIYRWPRWLLQDEVRRREAAQLEPAIAAYRAALAANPGNGAAHRRLGQIALSQGDYALAHQHLLAAYAAHPHDQAVQQLLGETYALTGNWSSAVEHWLAIDVSYDQLDLRRVWHEALGEGQAAIYLEEAISLYERALSSP